ncbi:hypothetical protein WJ438_15540 [Streptomyces sp. GD-15H]
MWSVAGFVHRKRGDCGRAYDRMKAGSGTVIDNYLTTGSCN